jgi:hypothetical protein
MKFLNSSSILYWSHITVLKGKVTLEARWAGAGVPGGHGHAGGGVLTRVQAAYVKVRLELAVAAVVAGFALAGVAVVVSVRLQKAQVCLKNRHGFDSSLGYGVCRLG